MATEYSMLSDEELMGLIVTGQREAFAELVHRHARRFYSIAYRMLFSKDEAEDIVQEAFLKLWNKPEQWDKSKNTKFTTWFYKVVTASCLDYNKKKTPLPLSADMDIADNRPAVDKVIDTKRKQHMLDTYIRELPERQQMALNLCFYEGVSNKEAAAIMGLHVKALQSLLMRAKNTLKAKIHRYPHKEVIENDTQGF